MASRIGNKPPPRTGKTNKPAAKPKAPEKKPATPAKPNTGWAPKPGRPAGRPLE